MQTTRRRQGIAFVEHGWSTYPCLCRVSTYKGSIGRSITLSGQTGLIYAVSGEIAAGGTTTFMRWRLRKRRGNCYWESLPSGCVFGDEVIEVVEANIATTPLPDGIDVLICEMMETGLLDELQVPTVNRLRIRGVVSPSTKLIPHTYETFLEFGLADVSFYGFTILFPRHN